MNSIAPESRQSQTEEWLSNLQSELQGLDVLTERLHNRLMPVTRQNDPIPSGPTDKMAPEPMLVDLADRLRSATRNIQVVNQGLSSLIDRIEL